MQKPEIRYVDVSKLILDPNNYRLINEKNYQPVEKSRILEDKIQKRTLDMLCGSKNDNIQDLIDSFMTNDYLFVDQIQTLEIDNTDKLLVIEGNRRVATLKVLQTQIENNNDVANFSPDFLHSVPVIVYKNNQDGELKHLVVMGLKHISGNKKWGEWNQAQLIKRLTELGNANEEEICSSVGIDKTSLRRNLRALSLIEQYKKSDYGDQFTTAMYPIFREIITYTSIKDWLEWNESLKQACNESHTEILFSLLSKDNQTNDYDEKVVFQPAITKREEVRIFSKILEDEKALSLLVEKRDITFAFSVSKAANKELISQNFENSLDKLKSEISIISQISLPDNRIIDLQKQVNLLQTYVDNYTLNYNSDINSSLITDTCQLTELNIEKYRKFENIYIKNLKRINIFAGINNAGKTTILEAIYLLCKQNDFNGLLETIRLRGKLAEKKIPNHWFLEQLSVSSIKGNINNISTNISFKTYNEDVSDFDKSSYLRSLQLNSNYDNHSLKTTVRFFGDSEREIYSEESKNLCRVIFSSPFFLNEPYRYSEFYNNAIQSKALSKVIDFIHDKILNSISDIRLVDKLKRFLVIDNKFDSAMDLNNYGEGLQRIFFICLLFASAKNGILLIDEVENAIHVGLMNDFVLFIKELSLEYNVQVFLTSHSKECIDAFVNNLTPDDALYCALTNDSFDKTSVEQFSGRIFKKLLETSDTDLRKTI